MVAAALALFAGAAPVSADPEPAPAASDEATGGAPVAGEPAGDPPGQEELSADDAKFLALAQKSEAIEIWGDRPDRPFDRDTEVRLTGAELARLGVSNLAEALELIPEINVRESSRGGRQIDVRGARKSAVKVFVDGIPVVSDPYHGNFDVSAIPVTDIVEVRISTSPASPIDGTGGPGAVVDVLTRDAVGDRWIGVRGDVNTFRQALGSASARSMLSSHWAARVSATGELGSRDLAVVMPTGEEAELDEQRRGASGSLRLEYRRGKRRAVTDVGIKTGSYVVPPSETESGRVVVVDGARDLRVGTSADDEIAGFRMQLRGYFASGRTRTTFYPDATLDAPQASEDVRAESFGGGYLVNRPVGEDWQLIGSTSIDSEHAVVDSGMDTVEGRATIADVATGFKYERGKLRGDAAVGVAIPVDVGATPWPEAKLSARYSPLRALTARVVLAHKGRLPTLRERYEVFGNQALGPEKALFAELGLALEKNDLVSADVAGYVRRTNGLIRTDPSGGTMLVNLGELTMRGIDARATLFPYAPVHGGASVSLVKVTSAELGDDSVDRLPGRRGDVWVAGEWNDRLGGRVRYRYIGEMQDQGTTLDDYFLLDVSGHVRITDEVLATLRLENALGERYLDRASGVMGAGRAALLSVQGTWE